MPKYINSNLVRAAGFVRAGLDDIGNADVLLTEAEQIGDLPLRAQTTVIAKIQQAENALMVAKGLVKESMMNKIRMEAAEGIQQDAKELKN